MKRTVEAFENHLLSLNLLTEDQIQKIRKEAAETKLSFKKACLKLGFVKEDEYVIAEAGFLEVPFANLDDYLIDAEILKLIPAAIAKQHGIMPLFKLGDKLTVAMHDPYNIFAVDQIRELTGLDVDTVISTESDVIAAVREYYGGQEIAEVARNAQQRILEKNNAKTPAAPKVEFKADIGATATGDAAPVIKLVDQTILQALEDKASDIHIEPEAEFMRIRNRIDGVLVEVAQLPKNLQLPVISRIKVMAKLDISETRKPQDGKIRITAAGKDIDIRVSSFPTLHGENIVLRILDRSNIVLDLSKLGFAPALLTKFKTLLDKPYGIILVTGPTGAGKTTTLYAALQTINQVDLNIMTIEDPIEYQIPMIRQTQVNVKAGLTFASGLRSLLRQDPDVMLVGEIRDQETAEIAIESALTGHLVFSTLHTNDAPGAVTRLNDMGVEPFLISSSLIGVLAQRLVRVLCTHCKKEKSFADIHLSDSDRDLLLDIHRAAKGQGAGIKSLYAAEGCKNCKRTGYRGRMAIFELLMVDDAVRQCIARKAPIMDLRKHAFSVKNPSLKIDGFSKVIAGLTSVEEVLGAVQDE